MVSRPQAPTQSLGVLAPGGTGLVDGSIGPDWTATFGAGNATLNIQCIPAGCPLAVTVFQDAGGARTLTWGGTQAVTAAAAADLQPNDAPNSYTTFTLVGIDPTHARIVSKFFHPFSPLDLNAEIWLPTSSAAIAAGNLAWSDLSGNHNDAAMAASVWSKVAASPGVPAHLQYTGGTGASLITGTFAVGIAAGTPWTLYVLRQIAVAGTGGKWFSTNVGVGGQPFFALDADAFGGGRVLGGNFHGSEFLSWNDVSTAWVVDCLIQDGAGGGTLYRGTTLKDTQPFSNMAAVLVGDQYGVGGSSLVAAHNDTRGIAELCLFGTAHNSSQRIKMNTYFQGTIPPP